MTEALLVLILSQGVELEGHLLPTGNNDGRYFCLVLRSGVEIDGWVDWKSRNPRIWEMVNWHVGKKVKALVALSWSWGGNRTDAHFQIRAVKPADGRRR